MTDEPSETERPVREVPTDGQLSLYPPETPRSPGDETSDDDKATTSAGPTFIDRNPEAMTIGGTPLREYLVDRELEWVLVMREVLRGVDWRSFEARYDEEGRPSYHPAPMAAIILYGLLEGKGSLRALEELARTDLACMWLSGGIQPDHSTLGRFVQRHADQLREEGFKEVTQEVLEVFPEVDQTVAGDGSVVEARASALSQLEEEAAEEWSREQCEEGGDETSSEAADDEDEGGDGGVEEEEADDETSTATGSAPEEEADEETSESGDDQGGGQTSAGGADARDRQQRAKRLKQEVEVRDKKGTGPLKFSKTEPQARWHQYKDGGYGFGYVASLMVNSQRVIVGQALDQSSEVSVVEEMLGESEGILGEVVGSPPEGSAVGRLMLDNNYFALDVLEAICERSIDALIWPDHPKADGEEESLAKRGGKFHTSAFEYDPQRDAFLCPNGEWLEKAHVSTNGQGHPRHVYGRQPETCEGCPLRGECTESERGRTVERYEGDTSKQAMRQVMEQDRAREAYAKRMGIVEPVFGRLEELGWERSRRWGEEGVETELGLYAMAHNLDRLRATLESGRMEIEELPSRTSTYSEEGGAEEGEQRRSTASETGIKGLSAGQKPVSGIWTRSSSATSRRSSCHVAPPQRRHTDAAGMIGVSGGLTKVCMSVLSR